MLDVDKIYTAKEIMAALGVDKNTLEAMRREGMPYIKRGNKRWWSGCMVAKWLVDNYTTDVHTEARKATGAL